MSISANLGGKKSLLFFITISSWHPYGHWNFCKLILLWAVSQTCKGQEREKSRKKTKTLCSRKIIPGITSYILLLLIPHLFDIKLYFSSVWYRGTGAGSCGSAAVPLMCAVPLANILFVTAASDFMAESLTWLFMHSWQLHNALISVWMTESVGKVKNHKKYWLGSYQTNKPPYFFWMKTVQIFQFISN